MAVKQIIYQYDWSKPAEPERDPKLGPFSTDENAWAMAQHVAETHIAGWLFFLAGQPVEVYLGDGVYGPMELAVTITVEGLARRNPHPTGRFVWQTEGAARIMAAGMEVRTMQATLADYRTTGGRIARKRSSSTARVKLMCAAIEAGSTPRQAFDAFRLPPLRSIASLTTYASDLRPDALPHDPSGPIPPPPDPTPSILAYYREAMVHGEVST